MDERLYRLLKVAAVVLTLAWAGWTVYDSFVADAEPGDGAYLAANKRFEDGDYKGALTEYEAALRENPEHLHALRGKARSLLQLERYPEALEAFNAAIARAPEFGGSYANRGILFDRMGEYEKALADYEHALRLDASVAEGPGWLTRFFRLQPEKPPTVADRAGYLRRELAKPEGERVLRVPALDRQQRPYEM